MKFVNIKKILLSFRREGRGNFVRYEIIIDANEMTHYSVVLKEKDILTLKNGQVMERGRVVGREEGSETTGDKMRDEETPVEEV